MPRSRNSRASRFAGSPRRKVSWEFGPRSTAFQGISSSSALLLGSGAQVLADALTLVRLRGEFAYQLRSAAAELDGYHGAFGIGVVQEEAFAVGITAVPTPITDADWDGWIYWQPIAAQAYTDAEVLNTGGALIGSRRIVDTKSMRKLNLGDVIIAVVEATEIGTAVLHVHFDCRVLLKLP